MEVETLSIWEVLALTPQQVLWKSNKDQLLALINQAIIIHSKVLQWLHLLVKAKQHWLQQVVHQVEEMYLSWILQEDLLSAHNQEKIRPVLEESALVVQEVALEAWVQEDLVVLIRLMHQDLRVSRPELPKLWHW